MGDTTAERPVGGLSVEPLRERVRGQVLTADDRGYNEARAVHNGMFDKRPLAVLRAEQRSRSMSASLRSRQEGRPGAVRVLVAYLAM